MSKSNLVHLNLAPDFDDVAWPPAQGNYNEQECETRVKLMFSDDLDGGHHVRVQPSAFPEERSMTEAAFEHGLRAPRFRHPK
jgi:hypothetical protein